MARLLKPRTIAVFGGNSAKAVIGQCQAAGFAGEIWAVNPNRNEINGVPCFATVADLPAVPDASFVAAPAVATVDIVRDLAACGATGAVCHAAGFAEAGGDGVRLQEKLREAAGDLAIIGPNCHGFLNYLDGVALWPDQHGGQRVNRGVALVLQSGNIGINLTMQQRSLDIGYVISIGNQSFLSFHDYIEMLLDDRRVTAIGLHIESIDNIHEFSVAAIKALRKGVAIVAMKTGRSQHGAKITMSHTGSMAGSEKLYDALFQRLGIVRCNTLAQFLETLKFMSTVGVLQDSTAASMSCSGGEASVIADSADAMQVRMPAPSAASAVDLQRVLGPQVHISNPLDYHSFAWGNYEQLKECFCAMLSNGFDCTMLVLDYPFSETPGAENWELAEQALIDAVTETGQRAVVVASLPETLPGPARSRLLAAGIAPMQGIDECLFAIRAAATIGKAQRNVEKILPLPPVQAICEPVLPCNEWDSKKELARFGLMIPAGKLCLAVETVGVAEELGFPVVLKAVSNDISHKSEVAAVAVNLRDKTAVNEATQRMALHFEQLLVEEMATPSVAEIIIGISRDPAFGLTLLLGAGGTLVELLDDTASLLLPVQRHEIRAALASLKVAKLIDGYRGGVAGDVEAVIDAVEAVAAYALAHNASLVELDINPLIVLPDGAVAADAFIRKGANISMDTSND